jgi:hypothetical protein
VIKKWDAAADDAFLPFLPVSDGLLSGPALSTALCCSCAAARFQFGEPRVDLRGILCIKTH